MLARRTVPEGVAGGIATGSRAESQRATAFRRLSEARLDDSYSIANAILGNPSDAQDAVHDAVITGWQKWPSLRDPAKFEPWFRRVVVNTCRDRLRREARRETKDISVETGLAAPDATAAIHDKVYIEQALAHLKPDDRIVLALRYYHDLKIDDIAATLDIPSGTATSRLRNAHTRLQDVLQRSRPEETPR